MTQNKKGKKMAKSELRDPCWTTVEDKNGKSEKERKLKKIRMAVG